MRTRFTKVLAIVLALVMTIGLLPMSAIADEAGLAGISGEYTYNGVTAKVSAPAGAFPEGTVLSILPVESETETQQIQDAIEETPDVAPVTNLVAFDISFLDASGSELQPAAGYTVDVRFDVSSNSLVDDAKELSVIHMEEQPNGETTPVEMETKDVPDATVAVEADSFSIYVVGNPVVATYNFYNGTTLVSTQTVKNGKTLTEPAAPAAASGESFLG